MSRVRTVMLFLSATLALFLALSYWLRPDLLAAVTFFPVWLWLLPGLGLALLGYGRRQTRLFLTVLAVWVVYVLVFAEEPWTLFRHRAVSDAEVQVARWQGRAVRLVSLNCGAFAPEEAAEEIARLSPDLVLLQESPHEEDVRKVARDFFGDSADYVRGPDASIIVHGAFTQIVPVYSRHYVQVRARLTNGMTVEIISLHLLSPIRNKNIFARDNFLDQLLNRETRREELAEVAARIGDVPNSVPLIVGGDFNAPAGDAVYHLLKPRLRDTFREAGIGWGDTILNDLPILRIDEIWVDDHFRPAVVYARKTAHSDHRMVVCDLALR